jgi:hypothetical protein
VKASKGTAHLAGVLYLLMGVTGFYNLMIVPAGLGSTAAEVASHITAAETTYRVGLLSGLAANAFFIGLVVVLYALFKDVDRDQARLLVLFVAVEIILGLADLTFQGAPLVLLSGADFLSGFTRPQLESLSMIFLKLYGLGIRFAMTFWGLWLVPLGVLEIKSGWFPKVLGWLLFVAAAGYVAVSVAWILFPARAPAVNSAMMPFYSVGEGATILWLLIMGAKVPVVANRTTA